MLLRIVKSNSPFVLFLFFVLTVALWLPSFKGIPVAEFSFDYHRMPFYNYLYDFLIDRQTLQIIIALGVLLLQCFLLLKINRKYILLNTQNYLPAIVFIILTSSFIQLQRINPALFAGFFILLTIDQLFSCYRVRYVLDRLFVAGLLVSVASLFYSFSVFFLLIIWISLILLRGFSIREWFVPILGFIFPYLFVFGYYYLSDSDSVNYLINLLLNNFFQQVTITHYNITYYLFYGFVGLLIVFGSFKLLKKFQTRKIYIRKFFEIFWWIFLVSLLLFLFKVGVSTEIVFIFAIPVSFLLAYYFNSIRSGVFGNIVLFILAGLIVLVYYTNG
jgi:hypothetical protein